MTTLQHKNLGFILVINLIVLLLLAILISSMYKNSLLQLQMSIQFRVKHIAKQHVMSSLTSAKQHIQTMLKTNQDFSHQSQGFYPKTLTVNMDTLIKSGPTMSFNHLHGDYIIHHVGKAIKLSGNNSGIEHQLFFIYSMSDTLKGARYVHAEFLSIDPMNFE